MRPIRVDSKQPNAEASILCSQEFQEKQSQRASLQKASPHMGWAIKSIQRRGIPRNGWYQRLKALDLLKTKQCSQIVLLSECLSLSCHVVAENKAQPSWLYQGSMQAVTMKRVILLRDQRLSHTKDDKKNRMFRQRQRRLLIEGEQHARYMFLLHRHSFLSDISFGKFSQKLP